MAVLRGSKKFTVFDPTQYEYIYGGQPFVEAQYDAQAIQVLKLSDEEVTHANKQQQSRSGGGGGGGVHSGVVHVDVSQDVLNQKNVEGEVEVEVLSWRPSEVRKLKVEKPISMSTYSPINISSPNVYQKYPKYKHAIKHECDVQEGDLLYLPARWWHEVESSPDPQGKTVAVNFW